MRHRRHDQARRGSLKRNFLICRGLIGIDCGRIKHKLMSPYFTNYDQNELILHNSAILTDILSPKSAFSGSICRMR